MLRSTGFGSKWIVFRRCSAISTSAVFRFLPRRVLFCDVRGPKNTISVPIRTAFLFCIKSVAARFLLAWSALLDALLRALDASCDLQGFSEALGGDDTRWRADILTV